MLSTETKLTADDDGAIVEVELQLDEDLMDSCCRRGRHDTGRMSIHDLQRERLSETIRWAKEIRQHLQGVLDANKGRVHFRPSSGGVAMIGLTPDRPQRGKSGIKGLEWLADNFEEPFQRHCVEVDQGRATVEKALQSWMIAEAYRAGRKMASLIDASTKTNEPVELLFITDEIALPTTEDRTGRIVCDILALRVDGGQLASVVIELKTERQLTRLVEQVMEYAALVDEHCDLFAELYSTILGREVSFTGPCEKWIVWPHAGDEGDPREEELAEWGIRVVGYQAVGEGFGFRIGQRPR